MSRTSDQFLQQFRAARRVSTPIVNVRTPDPESSLSLIKGAVKDGEAPFVQWDTVRGLVHHNEAGRQEISRLLGEIPPSAVISAIEVLTQPIGRRTTQSCSYPTHILSGARRR